jgi:hypothetical protein
MPTEISPISAKLVPNSADRGCHLVSVTDFYGRIPDFLDQFLNYTHEAEWNPFQTHYFSENPSFATIVQGVYCTYSSTATCFGPHWPSSAGTHNIIYKEVILTTDSLSVVQTILCTLFDRCCRRLFKCDCEVSQGRGPKHVAVEVQVQ